MLAQVNALRDVLSSEDFFGVQLIVRATSDAQIRRVVGGTSRLRLHVIELHQPARRATVPLGVDERAMFEVARTEPLD